MEEKPKIVTSAPVPKSFADSIKEFQNMWLGSYSDAPSYKTTGVYPNLVPVKTTNAYPWLDCNDLEFVPVKKKVVSYPNPYLSSLKTIHPEIKKETMKYRTQKANSVVALQDNGYQTPDFKIYHIESLDNVHTKAALIGRFVRPCPVTPRHGFVDSRVINTLEEADALVSETLKADPRAEVISMPLVESAYSAIWTDGSIIVGTGNDGATAGKDSVSIPVIGTPYVRSSIGGFAGACKAAGITDAPYVEMLWKKFENTDNSVGDHQDYAKPFFVQLRNGPKVPSTVDYIPYLVKIEHVELAAGDLLEWETKIKTFPKNTVVHHPGGSLASHYAVHAVLNHIPIVTSHVPRVGEILEPVSEINETDIKKFRAGFIYGCNAEISPKQATRIMLAGCHNASVWYGKQDDLLGVAIGCAYRLIVTAALGEYRHRAYRALRSGYDAGKTHSRGYIYRGVWKNILKSSVRTKYLRAVTSFQCDNWKGSFGGRAWFELSAWAGKLYNALIDGDTKALVENLNKAMNAVHNGGWAFNKFTEQEDLDRAAANPMYVVQLVAPLLYIAKAEVVNNSRVYNRFFSLRKKVDVSEMDVAPHGGLVVVMMKLNEDSIEIQYKNSHMGSGALKTRFLSKTVLLTEEGMAEIKKFQRLHVLIGNSYYKTVDYKENDNESSYYSDVLTEEYPYMNLKLHSKYITNKEGDDTNDMYTVFRLGGDVYNVHKNINIIDEDGKIILDKKYLANTKTKAAANVQA